MIITTLTIRFILELTTVLATFSGIFISKNTINKIIFFTLTIFITILWSRYGAPKSPNALQCINKFFLEIFVFSIGTVIFYKLFGNTFGTIYLVTFILDLLFMYLLGLQGK